jgi:beta-phosphoglucomutase family hydrolase
MRCLFQPGCALGGKPERLKTLTLTLLGQVLPKRRSVIMRLWDSTTLPASEDRPRATLVLRRPEALARMLRPPLDLAAGEAYLRGDFEVEGESELNGCSGRVGRRLMKLRIDQQTPRLHTLEAVIFDLDGVVTDTASVHAAAWKRTFDAYLNVRGEREERTFAPFDLERDYLRYVDGKPRYEGVRDFLASRGLELPWGSPDDPPERETICGLGNRKDRLFREQLEARGVKVYSDAISFIRQLQARGLKIALVSSSKNTEAVLEAAGLSESFAVKVDGLLAERLALPGKPAPDAFLEAARRLGVPPERSAVVEDAVAGVEAGVRGGFALVVGVARGGGAAALRAAGAGVVVGDLSELELDS